MKTLHLLTPSIISDSRQTIRTKGYELALREGRAVDLGQVEPGPQNAVDLGHKRRFDRLFYAPLIYTMETALHFCQGLGYMPAVMPAVSGLGNELMLEEVLTQKFKQAVASGLSELSASLFAHTIEQGQAWAVQSRIAMTGMFKAMADGEIAVGFFPAFTIVLAAWAYGATEDTKGVWSILDPMEGLIFVDDGRDCLPYLAGKISVKTNSTSQ